MARGLTAPGPILPPARGWQIGDVPAAQGICRYPDGTGWLSPAMDRVADLPGMRPLRQRWIVLDAPGPAGRPEGGPAGPPRRPGSSEG